MTDNNGWPGKPGVPLNPERDGPHWLKDPDSDRQFIVDWAANRGWHSIFTKDAIGAHFVYAGPVLTPSEVEARIATARKEWLAELNHDTDALMENARDSALEEAALRLEELHKNHKYNPETGEGSEHDVGYYRALSEGAAWIRALDPVASKSAANLVAQARQSALAECIAACDAVVRLYRVEMPEKWKRPGGMPYEWKQAWENNAEIAEYIAADIRALSDTPPGTYASEAEQERDEFFNRLGRITEELRLPMDATASRIIEAIRERVDNEREACASVSVKVEVPDGAETWTPLEAWEKALLVFNEAFRDAIRGRALKGKGNE